MRSYVVQYELRKRKMKMMKKILALILALVMVLGMVACGDKKEEVEATDPVEAAPTEIVEEVDPTEEVVEEPVEGEGEEIELTDAENKLIAMLQAYPVELTVMTWALDIADAESMKAYTGIEASLDKVTAAAVTEPAMSSQAYSVVLVQVADAADAEAVAEEMKAGIDTAKWVCVEADTIDVAIHENYILLAMMSSEFAPTTVEGTIDAFKAVMNGEFVPSPEVLPEDEVEIEAEPVDEIVEGETGIDTNEAMGDEVEVPDEGTVEEDGAEGSEEAVG